MDNELLYCGIEKWTHCSYSSLYLSIFLPFKAKFVSRFSQELFKLESSILKHGIHMDNELLYCGIENWTHCSYSSLYLSIFLSFKAKFVSRFSQELFKLESSILECLC